MISLYLKRYITSTSYTDPEKGTDILAGMTLKHRKLSAGTNLQFWNATMMLLSKPGKRNVNISLTIEHVDAIKDHYKVWTR